MIDMSATEKSSRRRLEKASARKVLRISSAKKSVVLGVTGSIAAYKSAELASLLVKQGHEIFAVMTQDATEFISPLTLQTLSKNPVMTSFFDEKESWRPGHIALADRAPILVAPAMNGKMWAHSATVENVERLKAHGVEFIGPEDGMLACGYEGLGRLWRVNEIAFRAEFLLTQHDKLIA